MKNLILTLLLVLTSTTTFTQYCPYLGVDQLLPCGVNSTTLTADLSQCGPGGPNPNQTTNYGVNSIPYVAQTNTGTSLFMTDDSQQGPFNIGFNFCFFGVVYTQFYVGSNGWISFSGGQPTTFTSQQIPTGNAFVPKNCIFGPWQDWHPGIGGQIKYQMQGTAPCRKLVVSWVGVPMFSCTGNQGTFHIVIYESTNIIENHIQNKPPCLQWVNGTATQGIHNLGGTIGITSPGRNSTAWVTNNDSYRWTPSGPVVSPILTWYQVGNPTPIGTGPTINVTPPIGGSNYTCRFVYPTCNTGWSSCNSVGGVGPDTVFVLPGFPNLQTNISSFTEPICYLDCNGTATVDIINGGSNYDYLWSNGQTTQTSINLCVGTYNVLVTDNNGCSGNSSITINQPTQLMFNTLIETDVSCSENDGSVVMEGIGGTQPYEYLINNVISNDTINGLIGGDYLISIQDINGCQIDSNIYLTFPIPITPSLIPLDTVNCIPGDFIFTNLSTPIINIVSSYIQFGDNSDITMLSNNNITHTYSSVGVWDIIMSVTSDYGCIYTDTFNNIVETKPLPTAQFNISPNPTTFFEVTVTMQDQSYSDIIDWWWYAPDAIPSLSFNNNPTFTFPEGIANRYQIYLVVTDNIGCVDTTSRTLTVLSDVLTFIPNTFTPDGNEHNQKWGFNFGGIDEMGFSLYVFNRWGEIIWETHDYNEKWDGTYNGKIVQEGMYIWKSEFSVINTDERRTINGTVNIIR